MTEIVQPAYATAFAKASAVKASAGKPTKNA
jgi:hypothetical protein